MYGVPYHECPSRRTNQVTYKSPYVYLNDKNKNLCFTQNTSYREFLLWLSG